MENSGIGLEYVRHEASDQRTGAFPGPQTLLDPPCCRNLISELQPVRNPIVHGRMVRRRGEAPSWGNGAPGLEVPYPSWVVGALAITAAAEVWSRARKP